MCSGRRPLWRFFVDASSHLQQPRTDSAKFAVVTALLAFLALFLPIILHLLVGLRLPQYCSRVLTVVFHVLLNCRRSDGTAFAATTREGTQHSGSQFVALLNARTGSGQAQFAHYLIQCVRKGDDNLPV